MGTGGSASWYSHLVSYLFIPSKMKMFVSGGQTFPILSEQYLNSSANAHEEPLYAHYSRFCNDEKLDTEKLSVTCKMGN